MKDRIPKYPGRVMLTPVSGQTNIYDMVRADEPEEVGTPINKMTLLTDDTAESLGLDPETEPTPNMAFRVLSMMAEASAWKVGDVIETVRNDLGENWLLCNGDAVQEDEYPELWETLPYNTEWRPMAPLADFGSSITNKYSQIRPLPVAGQWFFHSPFSRYNVISTGQKAAIYDAVTDTLVEFDRPSVPSAVNACGIFGMTHDGDKYILGVYELNSTGTADDKVHLFTSTDLKDWTLGYSATMESSAETGYSANIYEAEDMSFDGENVLIYLEHEISTSTDTTYTKTVYAVDKKLTKQTKLINTYNSSSSKWSFILTPSGYWAYKPSEEEDAVRVFGVGGGTPLFGFSVNQHYGRIAFFSGRYWIGLPVEGHSATQIQVADLETNTAEAFLDVDVILGISNYGYLNGAEYDRNTNEWTLYCYSLSPQKYWAVRISADADPTDAANYTCEQIIALPENLSREQMKPDRSQIINVGNTDRALRDPNQKYLPTHDGETNKYICVSRNIGGGGINGVTGSCNCRLVFTDDGEGNVELEVIRRDE